MSTLSFPALDQANAEVSQLVAELKAINDKMEADPGNGGLKRSQAHAMKELGDANARRAEMEAVGRAAGDPAMGEPGSEPDARGGRSGGGRADGAKRAIAAAHKSGKLPDHAAEKASALLGAGTVGEQRLSARWAETTGDPAYESAFFKMLADPVRGHLLWNDREADAYRKVAALDVEMKGVVVGTDTAGGFMVPFTLDPSIMLTSDGSIDPLRRISRVVQTVTDSWNGVTSAGVTAEWKAEETEAAEQTPTLAQPSIPVHFGDVFIPFSYEWGDDTPNAQNELQMLMADAADQLQAEAHMNGTGTGQPTGVTVGLAAGSKVATATADTLVAADVFGLQNVLPPRFQPRAQWCSNLATANEIQQFETANGAKVFPEISDSRLLRKPWNEASFLDAAGDTATAGNDNVLLYGDFMAGFVIVDRIGTRVELIPNLVGANRRPTGQRGLFLWFRTGSDVVVDNALRLLTA